LVVAVEDVIIFADVEPGRNYQLASELYDRLRSLARLRMSGQRASHTLDPTGLANEAILRLLKCDADHIQDEKHFLSLAAEAMRQILVDHARTRSAKKRGGDAKTTSVETLEENTFQFRTDPAEVLAISEALTSLEAEDPDAATIVKMRTFVGMEMDEIAALLDVSRRTVERRWRFAMAELRVRLSGGSAGGSDDAAAAGETR
jgi:RNA polymerase sigma factor (TIGR02999 family)